MERSALKPLMHNGQPKTNGMLHVNECGYIFSMLLNSVLNKVYKHSLYLHSGDLVWISVGWFQREDTVSSTSISQKLLFRDHK
jgi:hypothetical protein